MGSANYNADSETSDIDTWAIVIEDNYDSSTYEVITHYFNDEVIWFTDIRAYINGLLYSDIWYVISLNTKYKIINPQYEELMCLLYEHRDDYAYNNVSNAAIVAKHEVDSRNVYFDPDLQYPPHRKLLYYILQILIVINIYKHHAPLSSMFYNESYGAVLKDIKLNCTYEKGKPIFIDAATIINGFNPTIEEYPEIAGLKKLSQTLIKQILQKYKEITNDDSNKA